MIKSSMQWDESREVTAQYYWPIPIRIPKKKEIHYQKTRRIKNITPSSSNLSQSSSQSAAVSWIPGCQPSTMDKEILSSQKHQ